jgi:hypothetical protein
MSDQIFVTSMHTDVTSEAVTALVFTPFTKFWITVSVVSWDAWLAFHAVTLVTGVIADLLSDVSDHHLFSDTVAFEAICASSTAFLPLFFVTGTNVFETWSAVVFTPSEVAVI